MENINKLLISKIIFLLIPIFSSTEISAMEHYENNDFTTIVTNNNSTLHHHEKDTSLEEKKPVGQSPLVRSKGYDDLPRHIKENNEPLLLKTELENGSPLIKSKGYDNLPKHIYEMDPNIKVKPQ